MRKRVIWSEKILQRQETGEEKTVPPPKVSADDFYELYIRDTRVPNPEGLAFAPPPKESMSNLGFHQLPLFDPTEIVSTTSPFSMNNLPPWFQTNLTNPSECYFSLVYNGPDSKL